MSSPFQGRFVICRQGAASLTPYQISSVYDYLQRRYETNVTSSSAVADELSRRAASWQTAKF